MFREDEQRLVTHLQLSKIDSVKHPLLILALLVKRLRQTWPKVRIPLRF